MAWKLIKSAPRDGTRIIVAGRGRDGFPYVGVAVRIERGWRVHEETISDLQPDAPSHWMPLPGAPEGLDPPNEPSPSHAAMAVPPPSTARVSLLAAAQEDLEGISRTAMIPRIIHQFWHTPDLPPGIADYVSRWRRHHPGWQHILWNDTTATDFIRSQFGGEAVRCFLACTIPAMRSDVFRLAAILAQGGVYADADGRSLLPVLPLLPVEPETLTLLMGTKEGQLLNGFIAAIPSDPFIQRLWDQALFNIRQPNVDSVSFASGPGLFRTVWRDLTPAEQSRVRIVSWHDLRPFVKFKLHTNELPEKSHWTALMREGPIIDFARADALLETTTAKS